MARLSAYVPFAIVLIVAGSPGCKDSAPDECEKAIARLDRMRARDSLPPDARFVTANAIDQCRQGGTALNDPVLRCALDSATDDATASCIDEGMERILGPSTNVDDEQQGAGKGLNPLLMDGF